VSRSDESAAATAQDTVAASLRVVLFDFDGVLMHGDAFHLCTTWPC